MLEHNRLRIERLTARYQKHLDEARGTDEAQFLLDFEALVARVIAPVMEELAAELRRGGVAARVTRDDGPHRPCVELALDLESKKGTRNVVGFAVIRWTGYPLQILAYLEVSPPPFDLERFARAEEVKADRVEQMLLDAVEHVLSCNAP